MCFLIDIFIGQIPSRKIDSLMGPFSDIDRPKAMGFSEAAWLTVLS